MLSSDLLDVHHAEQLLQVQRASFYHFLWGAFDELHRARHTLFKPNWHVQAMAYQMERMKAGDCKRLLITMPPRHLKSVTGAVAFPAWLLGHQPGLRIISASYGQDLAGRNLGDLRRLMESSYYRRLFPHTRFAVSGLELKTGQGGMVKATSVGGAITGFGADYIIVDDLMKAGAAASQAELDAAHDFCQHSVFSRLDNKEEGRIIAIQQRLHQNDVAAQLIEMGTFHHLNLPAIAEQDENIPIGPGRVHRRRKDEVLFPQQESRERLEQIQREMGPAFMAQYQQNPEANPASPLRWNWWKTFEERPARDELHYVVQSWDTANSAEFSSDFSVCLTWGRRDREWLLLDVFRAKLEYADLKAELLRLNKRWKPDKILIEQAASGYFLVRELVREHKLGDKVKRVPVKESKVMRFNTQVARLSEGDFLLPRQAEWLPAFRSECLAFPRGKHDDMVDALTQFLDWQGHRSGMASIRDADAREEYYR